MSPNAIATAQALPDIMGDREPIGTFKEVQEANDRMKQLIDSYDWQNTGMPGTDTQPDTGQFINGPAANSPLLPGNKFNLGQHTTEISHDCDTALTALIGPLLSQGACFVFNAFRITGVLPWIQLFIDMTAIAVLILYIYKKWIDAGAS